MMQYSSKIIVSINHIWGNQFSLNLSQDTERNFGDHNKNLYFPANSIINPGQSKKKHQSPPSLPLDQPSPAVSLVSPHEPQTIGRGLVLFWPTAIIAFSRFLSKVRYKMSSQMLLQTIKSQSGFKNANILQFVLANVTPIGPPEKCKVAIHAIQTVFLDPINVGSIVG